MPRENQGDEKESEEGKRSPREGSPTARTASPGCEEGEDREKTPEPPALEAAPSPEIQVIEESRPESPTCSPRFIRRALTPLRESMRRAQERFSTPPKDQPPHASTSAEATQPDRSGPKVSCCEWTALAKRVTPCMLNPSTKAKDKRSGEEADAEHTDDEEVEMRTEEPGAGPSCLRTDQLVVETGNLSLSTISGGTSRVTRTSPEKPSKPKKGKRRSPFSKKSSKQDQPADLGSENEASDKGDGSSPGKSKQGKNRKSHASPKDPEKKASRSSAGKQISWPDPKKGGAPVKRAWFYRFTRSASLGGSPQDSESRARGPRRGLSALLEELPPARGWADNLGLRREMMSLEDAIRRARCMTDSSTTDSTTQLSETTDSAFMSPTTTSTTTCRLARALGFVSLQEPAMFDLMRRWFSYFARRARTRAGVCFWLLIAGMWANVDEICDCCSFASGHRRYMSPRDTSPISPLDSTAISSSDSGTEETSPVDVRALSPPALCFLKLTLSEIIDAAEGYLPIEPEALDRLCIEVAETGRSYLAHGPYRLEILSDRPQPRPVSVSVSSSSDLEVAISPVFAGPSTSGYAGPSTSGYAGPSTSGYAGPSTSGYTGPSTSGYTGPGTPGHDGPSTPGYVWPSTSGYVWPSTAHYVGMGASRDALQSISSSAESLPLDPVGPRPSYPRDGPASTSSGEDKYDWRAHNCPISVATPTTAGDEVEAAGSPPMDAKDDENAGGDDVGEDDDDHVFYGRERII
ncbi:mucin-5AC [Galendromus occidentalis]|uniref:Mucin-5AC n=1 Tax=Galendromus occidentalis TaxID=34638 RepID=A0AAJ7L625_9ACAR|nr:mucin-5AC [Galendromus occidentalis]